MRSTARFVCIAWLVAAVACSDDGLNIQGLNSSSSGIATGGGDSTGQVATTADSQSPDASGSGESPGDTTGPADSGPTSTEDGTAGPIDTTGTGDTGDTGTGTGTGTTGTGTTGEACDPITEDPSGIGTECRSDLDCLPGYTCQSFEGFAFQQTCQILCTMACECPMGLACLETSDKSGAVWFQCG